MILLMTPLAIRQNKFILHENRVHKYNNLMLKNITFTAEEEVIRRARARAKSEHSTLNLKFRDWLLRYSGMDQQRDLEELFDRLSYADPGRKFTREEMNER